MNTGIKNRLRSVLGKIISTYKEQRGNGRDDTAVLCYKEGFWCGAVMRVNAAWHGNDEEPREDRLIIVQLTDGDYEIGFYDEGLFMEIIIRWAYVEELLPERKEEQK